MKRHSEFCITKKVFIFPAILISGILLYIFIANSFTKKNNHIQSKAATLAIIGGMDVQPGEYPSVVYIKFMNDVGIYHCTGILIAPRWVATAGHCLGDEWKYISVSVGITKKSEISKTQVGVIKKFKPLLGLPFNDIGLLLLARDVNLASYPKLPIYETDIDTYKAGNEVTMIGWGYIGFIPAVSPTPKVLIEADTLQKIQSYIHGYIDDVFFKYRYLVIGDPGKEILQGGDSGGPVFFQRDNDLYLVGINSNSGFGYDKNNKSNTVVNVAKYTRWINDQISKNTAIYPTTTPAPFVNDHQYDTEWRTCSQFLTEDQCNTSGGSLGCGFQMGCDVCMPWNHSQINYGNGDCPSIIEKISIIKATKLTPTTIPVPPPRFFTDTVYDDEWRTCAQYKTMEECNQKGGMLGCGYQLDCEVCMPWNHQEIDYRDCNNITKKIKSVVPAAIPKGTNIKK